MMFTLITILFGIFVFTSLEVSSGNGQRDIYFSASITGGRTGSPPMSYLKTAHRVLDDSISRLLREVHHMRYEREDLRSANRDLAKFKRRLSTIMRRDRALLNVERNYLKVEWRKLYAEDRKLNEERSKLARYAQMIIVAVDETNSRNQGNGKEVCDEQMQVPTRPKENEKGMVLMEDPFGRKRSEEGDSSSRIRSEDKELSGKKRSEEGDSSSRVRTEDEHLSGKKRSEEGDSSSRRRTEDEDPSGRKRSSDDDLSDRKRSEDEDRSGKKSSEVQDPSGRKRSEHDDSSGKSKSEDEGPSGKNRDEDEDKVQLDLKRELEEEKMKLEEEKDKMQDAVDASNSFVEALDRVLKEKREDLDRLMSKLTEYQLRDGDLSSEEKKTKGEVEETVVAEKELIEYFEGQLEEQKLKLKSLG